MKFLFNERKAGGAYHYWNEAIDGLSGIDDTYCRLWSTGGICTTKKGWLVTGEKPDRKLCHMCGTRKEWELQILEKIGL